MGKLTAEQQATLDQLQALASTPDEGTDVYVQDDKGRTTKLTGSNAERWLSQLFGDDQDASKKTAKKAAKKATGATAGDGVQGDEDFDGDEDSDGDEESDAEPERRHWLFGSG